MRNLRIGIVSHAGLGGSGVVASELASLLAGAGHVVHMFCTDTPPRVDANVTLHRIEPPAYPVFDAPPYTIAMATALAAGIDAHGLDIVHVHYALPYALSARLAMELATRRPRLVVTLHGTDVTGVGALDAYAPALRVALRAADITTTPSLALAEDAYGRGLTESLPHVVPNFVSTKAFSAGGAQAFDDARPRLVHMSNYRPVKRADWLISALVAARRNVDAELLLIGEGPELESVRSAADAAGVFHAVREVGAVDDPAPYLRSGTLFAMPSAEESFGLSALEAMACGLPVVGCAVGGLPEVVGDEAGLLVADELQPFADAAADLLAQPKRLAAMRSAAIARAVDIYTPSRALAAYLSLYQTA